MDLIPGVEIITSYKGVIIEIIGYEIDIDVLDELLQRKSEGLKSTKEVLYEGLNRVIEKTGITFDRSVIENVNALVGPFYKELMSYPENKRLFENEETVDTLKKFIYNHLYNPDSPFFVDMSPTKPKLEDVIDMIHKSGGRASLAHAGRYKSLDMKKKIDEIIKLGLDAIEVYYPDHNQEFEKFLLGKAKEYGLDVTGGSDDHRNPKEGEQYKMGNRDIPQIPESNWIENTQSFTNSSKTINDFRKRLRVLVDNSTNNKQENRTIDKKDEMSLDEER